MSKTKENLKAVFAGESQANRKYVAFARKADAEGYPEVAELFRSTAEGETAHALRHLELLKEIGSTEENLKAAIEGETYEHTKMYPEFAKIAEEEGEIDVAKIFRAFSKAEEAHAKRFREALQKIKGS